MPVFGTFANTRETRLMYLLLFLPHISTSCPPFYFLFVCIFCSSALPFKSAVCVFFLARGVFCVWFVSTLRVSGELRVQGGLDSLLLIVNPLTTQNNATRNPRKAQKKRTNRKKKKK
eukprot:TRINITY_DN7573_c0_g1_i3.p1 TRINITY_DN7573_c0_g1~~TRINITY_DN7573_c0_g1_i3.p1  ORF type:complete len:117 (-),score=3.04 TRINITY_DN7573_c0_g1_i3:84-434(-)